MYIYHNEQKIFFNLLECEPLFYNELQQKIKQLENEAVVYTVYGAIAECFYDFEGYQKTFFQIYNFLKDK